MESTTELRNKIRKFIETADESFLQLINEIIRSEKNEKLEDWQKQKILKGIDDIRMGNFSSSKEVRKKIKGCIK